MDPNAVHCPHSSTASDTGKSLAFEPQEPSRSRKFKLFNFILRCAVYTPALGTSLSHSSKCKAIAETNNKTLGFGRMQPSKRFPVPPAKPLALTVTLPYCPPGLRTVWKLLAAVRAVSRVWRCPALEWQWPGSSCAESCKESGGEGGSG